MTKYDNALGAFPDFLLGNQHFYSVDLLTILLGIVLTVNPMTGE
jgi:hypothetical protein